MATRVEPTAPRLGWRWWLGATVALVGAVLIGAAIGPADIGFFDTARALVDLVPGIDIGTDLSERELAILQVVRFPRVILGVIGHGFGC